MRDDLPHQVGQQIGRYGVDHAQAQRAGERVFAASGNVPDVVGLLKNALRLAHDFFPQRRDCNFVGVALEQLDLQFFLQLFDGHTERWLRDMTGISPLAKVLFASDRDDVFKFGQRHGVIVRLFGFILPSRSHLTP